MKFKECQRVLEKICFAVIGVLFLQQLKFPVAWMMGPMLSGIVYANLRKDAQPFSKRILAVSKASLGLAAAARFSPEVLGVIRPHTVPLLLCVFVTTGVSLFQGYLLGKWSNIDRTIGFLAFIPGAASSVVAIGEEMGADVVSLSLLQYLRHLIVISVIPVVASFIPSSHLESRSALPDLSVHLTMTVSLSLLFILCVMGLWLGSRLRLPAASFLGPFLVALLAKFIFSNGVYVPDWLFSIALALFGFSIGLRFNLSVVKNLLKAILLETCLVMILITFCLFTALGFHWITGVDELTSVLGLTPGGIEAMVATVIQLNGNANLVMTMQLIRMLTLILLVPWLTPLLVRLSNHLNKGSFEIASPDIRNDV